MNAHLILAGPFRGGEVAWNSLIHAFSTRFNQINFYIGSDEEWDSFTIQHTFINLNEDVSDDLKMVWEKCTHKHKERYFFQWSNLHRTFSAIKDNISEDDIVIKARNDIKITSVLPSINFKNNTIYVPDKEMHSPGKFNTSKLCNDQILIGKLSVMNKYFDLPLKYIWNKNSNVNRTKDYYSYSIEEILRNYLYQQNIDLETFELKYTRYNTDL